jgi:hypothetical protein
MNSKNTALIQETAAELLATLESKIGGYPSVTVENRTHALRLIAAAFEAVFNALNGCLADDEYAILVKHPGFIDRFLAQHEPPEKPSSAIWWADPEGGSLRPKLVFTNRQSAERCKATWEIAFAAQKEKSYTFVLMHTVMIPEWQPVN